MKYKIVLLMIFAAAACRAQSSTYSFTDYCENDIPSVSVQNMYIKDVEGFLDPFEGTWKWINGSNSLTIVIEKKEMVYHQTIRKYYKDELYANIKYVENGQVILNTLTSTTYPLKSYDCIPVNGEYRFSFNDPLKNKYGKVFLTLMNNNTQIKFYLRNNEGPQLLQPGETFDPDFTLPRRTEIILTKQ